MKGENNRFLWVSHNAMSASLRAGLLHQLMNAHRMEPSKENVEIESKKWISKLNIAYQG